MNIIPESLWYAFGLLLIHWPVGFAAVKGTLHLEYRWKPYLLGYLLSVIGFATVVTLWTTFTGLSPTQATIGWTEVLGLLIPIGISVAISLLLNSEFRKPESGRMAALRKGPIVEKLRSSSIAKGRDFQYDLRILSLLLTGVLLALSVCFPPWAWGNHRVGWGTLLGPTDDSLGVFFTECSVALPAAQKEYDEKRSNLPANKQIWQDNRHADQAYEHARQEAILKFRSQGRDPDHVTIDGRDLQSGDDEPAVTAEPAHTLEEPNPEIAVAAAAAQASQAKAACGASIERARSYSRIDYEILVYQLAVTGLVGALAFIAGQRIQRRPN